jgi:hypothetical protein
VVAGGDGVSVGSSSEASIDTVQGGGGPGGGITRLGDCEGAGTVCEGACQ